MSVNHQKWQWGVSSEQKHYIWNILNTSQKAEASSPGPYLSPETNPASSASAVNHTVNLAHVRLEGPVPAPSASHSAQADPLRAPSTEAAHIMLRAQEPSLSPHVDPAEVPVCSAHWLVALHPSGTWSFLLCPLSAPLLSHPGLMRRRAFKSAQIISVL